MTDCICDGCGEKKSSGSDELPHGWLFIEENEKAIEENETGTRYRPPNVVVCSKACIELLKWKQYVEKTKEKELLVASGPCEKTREEIRTEFLNHIRSLVSYWAGESGSNVDKDMSVRERLTGLVHSILVTIDGCSCDFPIPLTLVTETSEDHRRECEDNGDDWYPDGCDLNSDVHLHDEYFREEREKREAERVADFADMLEDS